MPRLSLVIAALFFVIFANGQRKQGSWQNYLSFANATKVAVSSTKVYCVTEGGLFYFDRQDNSVNKFSAVNGLSDFGIKTTDYSEENNLLIVAYRNSNVDLVLESGVVNLSDIKRKQITGDKNIYDITVSGNEAYLSCGFGIVVLNLERREVKDTYFIGEDGTSERVNDVAIFEDYIFAATNEGIFRANRNDNLLNYSNWSRVDDIPHLRDKFNHLAVHNNKLIANYTPDEWYADAMYAFNGNTWEPYFSDIKFAYDIQQSNEYLTIASRSAVFVIDNNDELIGEIKSYQLNETEVAPISPRSADISDDGIIWIADYNHSLIKLSGDDFESIYPSGPMDNKIFSLNFNGNNLWVTPGGTIGWEDPRFQRFSNGLWKHFTNEEHPELDGFFNIVKIAVDPLDENHFFASSWGGGLLEFKNDDLVQRYTNLNSPLQTAFPANPTAPFVRILGLDFDDQGNLWMTNSEVAKNLLKLAPDGMWETFTLPEVANTTNLGPVLVTQSNDKWMLVLSGHDAYVVDETGTQKKRLRVTSYFNNGESEIYNRMNDVYSIAEDNEGAIWIGTSKGVAVYNNPQRIWTADEFYAVQPSLDLNDGIYHPLLETETVTAIAVDGSNRKWLGTSTSGIYLVSETGEEEILHFTKENSPLLSNTITSIAINEKSGEIFIGTDEGLISYQGNAIAGKENYANVFVYPNPVRETYDGPVTITGLIEQTDVKITDISGNLVHKTTSLGGQAVWDGNNLNGNRVKTGVYLVFCNDEFGEETHIAKLLFIN